MAGNQHVVPHRDKWAVRGEGNKRNTRVVATREQAIAAARGIARNRGVDVVIHGRDGRIRDKDSYGCDPFPPRDMKR